MNEVEALINGDENTFKPIYDQYHKKLYFFFLHFTNSDVEAEDLVQLSFVKLWKTRHNLSAELPLSQQLFTIGKSCMIDLFRKKSRQNIYQRQYINQVQTRDLCEEMPEFDMEQRIFNAIDQLPPVRKQVFTMSRIDGLSHKEISNELSVSVKTVEAHIYKALKQLKKILTLLLSCLY